MSAIELVEKRRIERGMSVAELSRRSRIEYDKLYGSIQGERKLLADEFVPVCKALDIKFSDFK